MGNFGFNSPEILAKAIDAFDDESLKEIKSFVFTLPEGLLRQTLRKTGSFRGDFLQRMSPALFRQWLKNRVDDRRTAAIVFSHVLTQFFNTRYKNEQADFFKKAGMPSDGHILDPNGNWKEYDWSKVGKAAQRLKKAYPAFPLESFLYVLSVYFRRNANRRDWAVNLLENTGLIDKLTDWHKADAEAAAAAEAEVEIEILDESERFVVAPYETESGETEPAAAPAPAPSPAARRPSGDWETVLDKTIRKLITASAMKEFGALTLEEIADMVDEIIHLNSARVESKFHAGFLEALAGVSLTAQDARLGEDAARYHTFGLLCGYAQAGNNDALVRTFDTKRAQVLDLLEDPDFGIAFGSNLEDALFAAERWPDSGAVLESRAKYLPPGDLAARLEPYREALSAYVRDLRAADGLDLSAAIDGALSIAREKIAANPASSELRNAVNGIARRAAQCMMAKKDFLEARSLLEKLAAELEPALHSRGEYAATLADLALARAAIADLARIFPLAREKGGFGLATLAAEKELLDRAVEAAPDDSPKARFLRGAIHFSNEKYEEAVRELEAAIPAMRRRWARTQSYPSLAAAHMMLAISLSRLDAQHNLDRIITGVELALAESVEFEWEDVVPILNDLYILGRTREAASLVLKMAECKLHPAKPGKDLLELIAALAAENDDVWKLFEEMIDSPGVGFRDRFTHYLDILKSSHGLSDAAVAAFIEKLDALATEHPMLMDGWIDFLLTADGLHGLTTLDLRTLAFERAWETGDEARLARAAESGLLKRMTTIAEKSKDAGDIDEVEEYLERLKTAGVSESLVNSVTKRLEIAREKAAEITSVDRDTLRSQLKLKGGLGILVIGGDEREAQCEEKCRALLESEFGDAWPLVNLKFNFTYWSHNFGRQFERMKAELASADAVVVHRMMRTILGRMIRKYINDHGKKWVTCIGRGADSLSRAVAKSVEIALFS
ncbi:MAG: hypothetical protein HRF49_04425 [bacterium]|jgi:hypothetical protein